MILTDRWWTLWPQKITGTYRASTVPKNCDQENQLHFRRSICSQFDSMPHRPFAFISKPSNPTRTL